MKRKEIRSLKKVHDYWKNPQDGHNLPKNYLKNPKKSKFLLKEKLTEEFAKRFAKNIKYLISHLTY